MAGEKARRLYCWVWRTGDLRVYLASSARGAVEVGLSLRDLGTAQGFFHRRYPSSNSEESKEKNALLLSAVEAAMGNRPVPRSMAMDIVATPFQWKAWRAIAEIPYGETRTYGEVADRLGSAGGARAVGQAMGRNPLPLIFP